MMLMWCGFDFVVFFVFVLIEKYCIFIYLVDDVRYDVYRRWCVVL